MRGILALDLSSSIGWCYGTRDAERPFTGTFKTTEPSLGGKIAQAQNAIIDLINLHGPSLVVMEAPLPLPAQNNQKVARQQFGLAAACEGECWRARVRVVEADVGSVRFALLGHKPRKDVAKAEVIAYCTQRGWTVGDDHAADAAMLWEHTRLIVR